jgi:hypothetical protein
MTPMAKEVREQLWQLVLATVEDIKQRCPDGCGTSRDQAWYSADGRSVSTIFDANMPDGSHRVYRIKATERSRGQDVAVDQWYHNAEYYWDDAQVAKEPERRVVVDGVHYRLGYNGDKPSPHNGYAGARWVVEFFTGGRVATHDLWYQGPVPLKYRQALPDNARFVCPDPVGHQRLYGERETTWRLPAGQRQAETAGGCPWCGKPVRES